MIQLYEALRKLNPNEKNILAKGCEGELLGETLILSGGETIFKTDGADALEAGKDKMLQIENSQKITIGESQVFCEILGSEKKLVICGAGHVSIPVIAIGRMIGFHVTVLEDRPSFADHARRAGADTVLCEDFAKGLDGIEGDSGTYFVIVTRGHRYDKICMEKILPKDNAYIGMIGSKLRVKKVLESVEEALANHPKFENNEKLKQALAKVYSPIGLKIHAQTPEEIGVSIIAEIINVKNEGNGSSAFSKEIQKEILSEEKKDIGKVLATIISRKGSAPRGVGTKMLFLADGTACGTIGGGCAEADIRRKSMLLLHEKKPKLYKVDMTGREAEEDGMVCGGLIEVLLEPILLHSEESDD